MSVQSAGIVTDMSIQQVLWKTLRIKDVHTVAFHCLLQEEMAVTKIHAAQRQGTQKLSQWSTP